MGKARLPVVLFACPPGELRLPHPVDGQPELTGAAHGAWLRWETLFFSPPSQLLMILCRRVGRRAVRRHEGGRGTPVAVPFVTGDAVLRGAPRFALLDPFPFVLV